MSHPSHPDGEPTTVADVVRAIDALTRGRVSAPPGPDNPWRVVKDSGIPGKAVAETPGLVVGDPAARVRRIGVAMSITEHHIELARAIGIDVLVAHHPMADAASSGGVPLASYLDLYRIAAVECHEALHGLHPGIPFLHGHQPFHTDGAFGGVHGKVVSIGRPLPGTLTLGDVVDRLYLLLERRRDETVLVAEREVRGWDRIEDSVIAPVPRILHGTRDQALGSEVAHVFPHTGFDADDLTRLVGLYPRVGALILSISTAGPDSELVRTAAHLGLGVVSGSSHATEILENGLPLAQSLRALLPGTDVMLLRDRVVALSLEAAAPGRLRGYRDEMARHLLDHATPFTDRDPDGIDRPAPLT